MLINSEINFMETQELIRLRQFIHQPGRSLFITINKTHHYNVTVIE